MGQANLIKGLSSEHGLQNSKPVSTLLCGSTRNSSNQKEKPANRTYRSMIGRLLYITVNTLSNISVNVSGLEGHVEYPDTN